MKNTSKLPKDLELILDLPHFHAPDHPYMSNNDRAAQFASYKALNGYEEMILAETNRANNSDIPEILPDEEYGELFGDEEFFD